MLKTAKLLTFTSILLFTNPIFADFYSIDSVDEDFGDIRTKRYTKDINGNHYRIGFLCKELSHKVKILGITFDSDTYIAQARQSVRLSVKVDEGISYPLYGHMGTMASVDLDSTNNGWAPKPSKQLLNELRTGTTVVVNVYNDGLKMAGEFSLSGSKSAIDDVVAACT